MDERTAVLGIGLAVALVLGVAYHFGVVAPRVRRMAKIVAAHDALLSGGAGIPASNRLAELEAGAGRLRDDLAALVGRVVELERAARTEFTRVGFVRFNAFADVGSDQSYALALLTADGDGVVLTSIYSREETRSYGKAVDKFQPAADASREERAAILKAKSPA